MRTPLPLPPRLLALLFRYLRSLLFPLRRLLFQTPLSLPTQLPVLLFRCLRSLLFPLRRLLFQTPLPLPTRLPVLRFRCLRSLLFPLGKLPFQAPLPLPTRLPALRFRIVRFPPALSPAIVLLCSPLFPFCFLLQPTAPASSHFPAPMQRPLLLCPLQSLLHNCNPFLGSLLCPRKSSKCLRLRASH